MALSVTYNGGALSDFGIAVTVPTNAFLSGLALSTFGFVYNLGDTWWLNLDATVCQDVTWVAEVVPTTTWTIIEC